MSERFTHRVNKIMERANQAAKHLGFAQIDTDHILIEIAAGCVNADSIGVLDQLRRCADVGTEMPYPTDGMLPFSVEALKVIDVARNECGKVAPIDVNHLLYALARVPSTKALMLMERCGIDKWKFLDTLVTANVGQVAQAATHEIWTHSIGTPGQIREGALGKVLREPGPIEQKHEALIRVPISVFHKIIGGAFEAYPELVCLQLKYRDKIVPWSDCEIVDVMRSFERDDVTIKVRSKHFGVTMPGEHYQQCDLVEVPIASGNVQLQTVMFDDFITYTTTGDGVVPVKAEEKCAHGILMAHECPTCEKEKPTGDPFIDTPPVNPRKDAHGFNIGDKVTYAGLVDYLDQSMEVIGNTNDGKIIAEYTKPSGLRDVVTDVPSAFTRIQE